MASHGIGSRLRAEWTVVAALATVLLCPASAGAVSLQAVGSFAQPIFVSSDPADPGRLFVVQRGGVIAQVRGGSAGTFADLTSVVRCCDGERGLLSMALPADFEQTGLFYVDYTGLDGPGNVHVAELRASGDGASVATLRNVLTIPHSAAANHNGGQLQFGPDGYLYISTGDGGATHTPAQDRNSLLGKILRIDPRQNGAAPYSIPVNNPFVGKAGADEVWSYGLRNPWRFSFDRENGDLLIADVGETSWEEVDYEPRTSGLGYGINLGWDCFEGMHPAPASITSLDPACASPQPPLSDPIFEYPHSGGACAITGGYVVRDPSIPELFGRYVYADYCTGQIRSLAVPDVLFFGDRYEGLTVDSPVSFGEDSCGRVYVVAEGGAVSRLTGSGTLTCGVLRVGARGPGRGSVTGPGIHCPADCIEVFPQATRVRLDAHPGNGSRFAGWHQACSGRDQCSITVNTDRSVVAKFVLATHVRLVSARKRVARGGRGSLRVKAAPCAGRRHDRVNLLLGGRRVAARRLNRHCRAEFHPRIRHRSRFRAKIPADKTHAPGRSSAVVVSLRG